MIKGYRREPPKISQICLFSRFFFSSLGALLKSSPFSHALAQTTILAEVNYTTSQRPSRAQWKHFFLVTVTQKAMIGRYSIFLHRMVLLLLLLRFFFSLSSLYFISFYLLLSLHHTDPIDHILFVLFFVNHFYDTGLVMTFLFSSLFFCYVSSFQYFFAISSSARTNYLTLSNFKQKLSKNLAAIVPCHLKIEKTKKNKLINESEQTYKIEQNKKKQQP